MIEKWQFSGRIWSNFKLKKVIFCLWHTITFEHFPVNEFFIAVNVLKIQLL